MKSTLNKIILIISLIGFVACDQLEEDKLPVDISKNNTVINNSDILAIPGQSTIIDVLGNPQESASIRLVNSSEKSEINWIGDRLIQYKAFKESSGKDFLIFDILTDNAQFTDTIVVHINDSSIFETDSCMPYAANDVFTVNSSGTAIKNVLENDQLCNYELTDVFIENHPEYGELKFLSTTQIQYTASANFTNYDSFIYRLILNSRDSVNEQRSVLALAEVMNTSDSVCNPVFITGADTINVNSSGIEIDVLRDDFLCGLEVVDFTVDNFSLGNIIVTDSNTVFFEPVFVGTDSLNCNVRLSDGNSHTIRHLITVGEDAPPACNEVLARDDTAKLNYPNAYYIDIQAIANDEICTDNSSYFLNVQDSSNLQYGYTEIIDSAGFQKIRYYADSVAWQSNINESFIYQLCQNQTCSEAMITITK